MPNLRPTELAQPTVYTRNHYTQGHVLECFPIVGHYPQPVRLSRVYAVEDRTTARTACLQEDPSSASYLLSYTVAEPCYSFVELFYQFRRQRLVVLLTTCPDFDPYIDRDTTQTLQYSFHPIIVSDLRGFGYGLGSESSTLNRLIQAGLIPENRLTPGVTLTRSRPDTIGRCRHSIPNIFTMPS